MKVVNIDAWTLYGVESGEASDVVLLGIETVESGDQVLLSVESWEVADDGCFSGQKSQKLSILTCSHSTRSMETKLRKKKVAATSSVTAWALKGKPVLQFDYRCEIYAEWIQGNLVLQRSRPACCGEDLSSRDC
ncbi:hypothetical protein NDU88_006041 [Pleurodeles waltl]|uniref:Uncharacterized protein n=1 Tax=Pleurodeles waltl TaxID=8319 RepID=A0AAV7RP58_PLEWA|nr:hypothetical protein NDU88_006041 [Pleurodeles waltl]